jgi:hypothetical protein
MQVAAARTCSWMRPGMSYPELAGCAESLANAAENAVGPELLQEVSLGGTLFTLAAAAAGGQGGA